jgi:hypothetical protein
MLIARRLYLAGDGPRPVRAGSAWPLSPDRSVRRGSKVKRDFACTFTRHLPPVRLVLRSQSCLRLEGRTRTLSGPSPDLSPARTLAPPSRREDLLIRRSEQVVPDRPSLVVGWDDIPELSTCVGRCSAAWQQCWQQYESPPGTFPRPGPCPPLSRPSD